MGNTETTLTLLERLREIIPDETELRLFCASGAMDILAYASANSLPFVLKRTPLGFQVMVVRDWGAL